MPPSGKRGRDTGIVNHYATLEVGDDADEVDIKKSYRSLVLRWHPDKNRENRASAEERIRLINSAYEVLSNPTKKEAYDNQRRAMQGLGPLKKKAKVSPKLSIPKEFMMQPLGHPDKFLQVSVDDEQVTVEARQASTLDFDEFFQSAKFSLWWLPEVNNSCRIRALGSKAARDKKDSRSGLAGGLNLAFKFGKGAEAPVSLAEAQKGQKSEAVNFIAVSSPVYDGAYRFEAANRKACFLMFTPPSKLGVVQLDKVMRKDEDHPGVLDFMLVDFTVMSKFIDVEEVLLPVMRESGESWVKISSLREHAKVKAYFENVLQKPVWDEEDFVSYFHGHWETWEHRASDQSARLRPSSEKLGQLLATANGADEVASIISGVGDDLKKLTLVEVQGVMKLLLPAPGAQVGETSDACHAALERVVSALQTAAGKAMQDEKVELSAAELVQLREQILHLPASSSSSSRPAPPAAPLLAELALRAENVASVDLAGLGSAALLALAMATAKLPGDGGRSVKLGVVAGAAAVKLDTWKVDDVIKLLLVSAKAKHDMPQEPKEALLKAAAASLRPQLKELASAEILKLLLAISGVGASGVELVTTASSEVVKRLSDFPQGQLLLLTQALTQGLGHQHQVVLTLLDFWVELLAEAQPDTSLGPALKPDQLVKLAQVATLVSSGSEPQRLFEVLGTKLLSCAKSVSAAGRSDLQAQLESADGLGKFSSKADLLQLLLEC